MGKKVMVWGASIGPFSAEPDIERFVAEFLHSADYVTVRETISQRYLSGIGVKNNVSLAADCAFIMTPQPVDTAPFWPKENDKGVLGFNISPLVQKFRPAAEPREVLQKEVAAFLKQIVESSDVSILLVPHVDPLDGATENSDSHYMREILSITGTYEGRIAMAPCHLNAAQIKYVLSKCAYFIGARTHATIGALSCLVPTVSIAYSIKAKGLNHDLFGNEDLVLDTQDVNASTLYKYYQSLIKNRSMIISALSKRIPEWKERALISPRALKCGNTG